MPIYKQTVQFEKHYEIEAEDAQEANEKLDEMVRGVEWDADIDSQGFYEFEDEDVECPSCGGNGWEGEDEEKTCTRCNGQGSIPFKDRDK